MSETIFFINRDDFLRYQRTENRCKKLKSFDETTKYRYCDFLNVKIKLKDSSGRLMVIICYTIIIVWYNSKKKQQNKTLN